MKKHYAFLLMGDHYNPEIHQFHFETAKDIVSLRTVRNFEEAKAVTLDLYKAGVGAIEICGAFGQDKAKILVGLTNNEVAIGYVVHDKELDGIFAKFFG